MVAALCLCLESAARPCPSVSLQCGYMEDIAARGIFAERAMCCLGSDMPANAAPEQTGFEHDPNLPFAPMTEPSSGQ